MSAPPATTESQTSNAVLMVRPAAFAFNAETAASNAFASRDQDVQDQVLREFDGAVRRLSDAGVEVILLEDSAEPPKPDAIFPNNWVSFHADGTMVLYPMAAATRRLERRAEDLRGLLAAGGFEVTRVIDLSGHEEDGRFLEGTGSLILDRPRRRAYASLSPRTDRAALAEFDARLGYSSFVFETRDRAGRPIYHTNVLMSLGSRFALLCLEAVAPEHRAGLAERLEASGHRIVEVDYEQLRRFACNVLELRGRRGESLIAMSSGAKASLRPEQAKALESLGCELIDADIPTIERVGGGGMRCMIADIHLPRLNRDS